MSIFDQIEGNFDRFMQRVGEPITYRRGDDGTEIALVAIVASEDAGIVTQDLEASTYDSIDVSVFRNEALSSGGIREMRDGDQVKWRGEWYSSEGDVAKGDAQMLKGRFIRGESYKAGGSSYELPGR